MNGGYQQVLTGACKRYGPGRLPEADREDVGAGYAAATAALGATVLYAGLMAIGDAVGVGVEGTVNAIFAGLAIPFVVPAAFVVGFVGWRFVSSPTPAVGAVAGGLGAIATYLVTLVLVGILLTTAAALSLSGATPLSAAAFSWGLIYFAFVFTWWVTIPIGCLAGFLYVRVITCAE